MYDNIFNQKNMIELQEILKKHNKTITCAESCTGGLISSMITKISGSSEIFDGAIISYSNKIKNQELNVSKKTLDNFGAVSIEVVSEMLIGSIKKFDADFSIAVSGIAGPNGGTKLKPVGTIVIGIMNANMLSNIEVKVFEGTREEVQIQTAKTALNEILKFVKKTIDK